VQQKHDGVLLECTACFSSHLYDARMNIILKTPEDIAKMRIAGRLAAEVLDYLAPFVQPGVTTGELDRLAHDYMVNVQGTTPATLGYHGFPKSICTSINHQICHGIPGDKVLKRGDIINIDVTVIKDGYFGDTSRMYELGEVSILAKRLIRVTRECMDLAIETIKPGMHLGMIGEVIQKHAEKNGFSVVREYCGHGIGQAFHEDPQVLHYGQAHEGPLLQAGMTFTIEPMINAGKRQVKVLGDGWTVVTKDHSLSAQWEHTVNLTDQGCEILTLSQPLAHEQSAS
jgi:methionyl aminopeptidase